MSNIKPGTDIKNLCKICLGSERIVLSIEQELIEGVTVLQMIQSLYPDILVQKDAWFYKSPPPTYICTRCRPRLELSYEFQQQLISSDNQIKNLLNAIKVDEVLQEDLDLKTSNCSFEVVHVKYEIESGNETKSAADTEVMVVTTEEIVIEKQEDDYDNFEASVASDQDITFEEKTTKTHARPKRGYICNYCSKDFTRQKLKTHVLTCYRRILRTKGEVVLKKWKLFSKFKVDLCTSNVRTIQFKCKSCEFRCSQEADAKSHANSQTHKSSDFICSICSKAFINKSRLERHSKIHNSEKPFSCEQCGKFFNDVYLLRTHLNRHSGIKPFACTYCPFRFVEKGDLQKHIRTHTREKPFKCDLCIKSYATTCSLQLHKRIHTGIMLNTCDFCQKQFHTKSQLTVIQVNYCLRFKLINSSHFRATEELIQAKNRIIVRIVSEGLLIKTI